MERVDVTTTKLQALQKSRLIDASLECLRKWAELLFCKYS
jgi:hypothetical protein